MKITRLSLWHVPLTSHDTYYMANGKTCDTTTSVILKIDTDTGLSGWGEVCPIPHYLPAYAGGVAPALTDMAPILLGADPVGPEALMERLNTHLQGHVYAKSMIDTALWDLTGKAANLPLYALLGGRAVADMPLYHSITCVAPDEMARMAQDAHTAGMRQFQVKLGADADWQADVERLSAVRAATGPGPLVYGDWNCGADRLTATRTGRAVAHLDVMLEQPCTTIDECAAVRAATGLPMKLDESAHDIASLLDGHRAGCMDAAALKLSKFGGLSAMRAARDLCLSLGTQICIEDTWGSDITTAAVLHLAASTPARGLMNTCDLSHYVAPRLAPDAPVRQNGRISPPEGPVLAFHQIWTRLARLTLFSTRRHIMHRTHNQADWIARANAALPAGGFGNFDPGIIIRDGKGSRVWDEDGNEYIDYLIGSGPMMLGHGHPEVLEAIFQQLPKGQTFFANNAAGIELAEQIIEAVPCAEQLRYVTSGGEADMYAIRAARAFTGRDRIVKFEGGYHGMSAEAQMSLAPTRMVNFPQAIPDSAGIPESVSEQMLIAPFNDADYITSLLAEYGDQVAAIIVEPLQRIIPPEAGFLQLLRDEASKYGIVLIFDEVVTGFRFAYGGAQEKYGVTPDLCTLGKVIGGGFPLAALAGRKDIMDHFDKAIVGADKWLMQLGTLSGNPIAAVAGMKTMEILRRDGQYDRLRSLGQTLMQAASDALSDHGIAHQAIGDPTLFEIVFSDSRIRTYRDVLDANADHSARFNATLRHEGLFKSPGKTYPSLALTEEDIAQTKAAYHKAAQGLTTTG